MSSPVHVSDTDMFNMIQQGNIETRLAIVEMDVKQIKEDFKEHIEIDRRTEVTVGKISMRMTQAMWLIIGLGVGSKILTPEGVEFVKKLFGY